MDEPVFRGIKESDIDGVLTLMDETKPNIGGSRNASLYHALCNEALIDKRVVVVVGEEDSKIIAFFLAAIDRDRWRMSFVRRHPWIAIKMTGARVLRKLRRRVVPPEPETRGNENNRHDIRQYIQTTETTKSWKDSSPRIAKLLFICVQEGERRKHVSLGLYQAMIEELAKRGVSRVDGIILLQNIPSIRLSHKLGFHKYIRDSHIFVTKDLA
jgi:hypothetical protein